MSLENVKTLLGVDDDRVTVIYNQINNRLLNRLSESIPDLIEIPEELEYIVDEVTIIRFNRLGSEGISSESLDGHSSTYRDVDFIDFEDDIRSYINRFVDPRSGIVRFL